jgi:predicted  nucleic acid-binding Zn-ribbon protein
MRVAIPYFEDLKRIVDLGIRAIETILNSEPEKEIRKIKKQISKLELESKSVNIDADEQVKFSHRINCLKARLANQKTILYMIQNRSGELNQEKRELLLERARIEQESEEFRAKFRNEAEK